MGVSKEALNSQLDDLNTTKKIFNKSRREMVKEELEFPLELLTGFPSKRINNAIKSNVTKAVAEQYMAVCEAELLWAKTEIINAGRKGVDNRRFRTYRNDIVNAKASIGSYIRCCEEAEEKIVSEATVYHDQTTPLGRFLDMDETSYPTMESYNDGLVKNFSKFVREGIHTYQAPVQELAVGEINALLSANSQHPADGTASEAPVVGNLSDRKMFYSKAEIIARNLIRDDSQLKRYLDPVVDSSIETDYLQGKRSDIPLYNFDTARYFPNPTMRDNKYADFIHKVNAIVRTLNIRIDTRRGFVTMVQTEGRVVVLLIYRIGLTESVTQAAQNAVRSGVNAVRNATKGESPVKKLERATEPLDNMINKAIDDFKDSGRDDRRNEIVEGKTRVKLIKVIGTIIAGIGLYTIHPAIAAIAFLGKMAHDGLCTEKEKVIVIRDLQQELAITKEKIKDADSKGDNENKYKLMRIENKLDREIQRIKYNNDDKPA